jgi:glycosyltransferase involved in cell wall biosynthesis
MKIAFVVPRYGQDIIGGAEYYARALAERLNKYHSIEILTTCAKSYHTWANEKTEGNETINSITVRRFKNKKERDINLHRRIEEQVFYNAHTRDDEIRWLDEQGPYSEDLLNYIKTNTRNFDYFIFFTFRYCLSYYGIKLAGDKSLIHPFAENDPALNLAIVEEIFNEVKGIIYSTPEERELIRNKVDFDEETKVWDIIGLGIEVPEERVQTNRLERGDYAIYLGRIDGSKGCYSLFDYFLLLDKQANDVPNLLLVGQTAILIPKHEKINYVGVVSEKEKFSLLKDAKFLIMPSPYESLSIVTLEAMACGTPVLVNGECDVLKGHCIRSNAGLWYQNFDEFEECSKILNHDDKLRYKMGINGIGYVKENYSWNIVCDKYLNLLEKMKDA